MIGSLWFFWIVITSTLLGVEVFFVVNVKQIGGIDDRLTIYGSVKITDTTGEQREIVQFCYQQVI
jgi:hypothetical protein